jgi:hypothetical protein
MMTHSNPIAGLFQYPLMQTIFGRRTRRFGLGMEIPSGPLAFKSRSKPYPLTELEQAVLVAAGTGVSGWTFGVPFGPRQPAAHAHFTQRFTGRTIPTAAGIGAPVLFYTDDKGVYLTNTRDSQPSRLRELNQIEDDAERILAVCREHTMQLSNRRLIRSFTIRTFNPAHIWKPTPTTCSGGTARGNSNQDTVRSKK